MFFVVVLSLLLRILTKISDLFLKIIPILIILVDMYVSLLPGSGSTFPEVDPDQDPTGSGSQTLIIHALGHFFWRLLLMLLFSDYNYCS